MRVEVGRREGSGEGKEEKKTQRKREFSAVAREVIEAGKRKPSFGKGKAEE